MSTAAQKLDPQGAGPATPTVAGDEGDLLETMPWLPCKLTLDVPVTQFTIANLLELAVGSIVETSCHQTSDLPLRVNNLLIGWTEFNVIGDRLAVRITEQA